MHGQVDIVEMIFQVMGGLAIFLLGMHNMSTGLQAVAGDKLRKIIGAVTNNKYMAAVIGTGVTSIVQSSSVTTVMVVGFVNGGLMTLRQALGVIMGANIGTTFTAWILVLKIGKWGLPILAISAFFYLFTKKDKTRFIAMSLMGVGMVFFGLEMMKHGFKPIRNIPEFVEWFKMFNANSYFGVLKAAMVGCTLTLIVQSSSATIGITLSLAAIGVIDFPTAAALVLGENIGTTITAFIASLNASVNAKRAAYGHVVFNIIGVIWITSIFSFYIVLIQKFIGHDPSTMVMKDGVETYPYIKASIAAVHSGFNIINTLLFLPFAGYLALLLEKIVPDKEYEDKPKLTNLDIRLVDTPVMILEQSRAEIVKMGDRASAMMDELKEILDSKEVNENTVKSLFHSEEVIDDVQKEITIFLMDAISSGETPHTMVLEAQSQIRIADEYESVSDYIISVLKLYLKIVKEGDNAVLSDEKREDLLALHKEVSEYFNLVHNSLKVQKHDIITEAKPLGNEITINFREIRERHMATLSNKDMSPLLGISYMNICNSYRKIKDHMLNISEAYSS